MRCGLLGRKLRHSYSPQIHGLLAYYSYERFEKEPEALEDFLRQGNWDGLNVTVPYKKAVIPYLDELSCRAKALGAVNTIVRRNGKRIGHNTDYFGFEQMLLRSGLQVADKKVLVLGSGGASNTAAAVLKERGARVVIISRSGEDHYQNLHRHADAAVIVNTTPVGMYPDTERVPIDLYQFPQLRGVLDVIYNPARTMLLRTAEELGLVTENGLYMLVAQAKESAEWFSGSPIPDEVIPQIHSTLRRQMENIILIGMPGCGKSTVGKILANSTGKTFVDADETIVALAGKSIPEIFAQDGEEVFRQWETEALAQLGKESGMVIATGGGCVTRGQNYGILHQNGSIFWIQRDLASLPTDGRPLSQTNDLLQMYQTRKPLYQTFADHSVENSSTPEATANAILHILEEIL